MIAVAELRKLAREWDEQGWDEQKTGRPELAQLSWACARALRDLADTMAVAA